MQPCWWASGAGSAAARKRPGSAPRGWREFKGRRMTSITIAFLVAALALVGAGLGLVVWQLRRHGLGPWLVPYLLAAPKRRGRRPGEVVHVLLCVADHYEPNFGDAS